MSALGDLIPQLSTTSPLNSNATFKSPPYLTTEYNSYSIIMYSDVNTNVIVQWSADSVHWDYVQSFNFPAGTGSQEGFAIANKWIQIIITDVSGINSTFMRFSAYASPVNNTIEIAIPPNATINANVRGSFYYSENGNLMTATNDPYQQYNFNYGTGSNGGNFQSGYLDLNATSTGKTTGFYSYNYGNTGSLKVYDLGPNGTVGFIYSDDNAAWMPGVGLECEFSAAYSLNQTNGTGVNGTSTLYCGAGSSYSTFGPAEGIFVGFNGNGSYNSITTPQNLMFGLIYISQANNSYTFIPQTSWNLDNCSGFYTMPNITTWANFNQFRLTILQNENIVLSILNPNTGIYVPCHYLNFTTKAVPSFRYPFFGLRLYQNSGSNLSSSDNTGLTINNWSMSYQNNPIPKYVTHYSPIGYIPTLSVGSRTLPAPYIAYTISNPTTWNGLSNFITLFIDYISSGFNTTQFPSYLALYKNLNITGGSLTPVDQYNTPANIYTTAPTLVNNTISGNSLFSIPMNLISSSCIAFADLSKYNIRLYPGETLSIVHFVYVSGNYNNITSSLGFSQLH